MYLDARTTTSITVDSNESSQINEQSAVLDLEASECADLLSWTNNNTAKRTASGNINKANILDDIDLNKTSKKINSKFLLDAYEINYCTN